MRRETNIEYSKHVTVRCHWDTVLLLFVFRTTTYNTTDNSINTFGEKLVGTSQLVQQQQVDIMYKYKNYLIIIRKFLSKCEGTLQIIFIELLFFSYFLLLLIHINNLNSIFSHVYHYSINYVYVLYKLCISLAYQLIIEIP